MQIIVSQIKYSNYLLRNDNLSGDITTLSNLGVDSQGWSGNWYYRKWNNGFAELWTTINYTPTFRSWNFLYLADPYLYPNFPFSLLSNRAGFVSLTAYGNGIFVKMDRLYQDSAIIVPFAAASGSAEVTVNCYFCGKWKN